MNTARSSKSTFNVTEEAEAFQETELSQMNLRLCRWQDYSSVGVFSVTLSLRADCVFLFHFILEIIPVSGPVDFPHD